jgi:hypothetical protein
LTARVELLLDELEPARRRHSLAVGEKAARAAPVAADELRADLVTAATLDDIGYAHSRLDLHPLDGASFLASEGFSAVVCHLVAHHSASTYEAEARGIDLAAYREFDSGRDDLGPAHAVVWWADLTTGPDGEDLSVEDRLDDIAARYPADHVVARNVATIRPVLVAAGQSPVGSIRVRS